MIRRISKMVLWSVLSLAFFTSVAAAGPDRPGFRLPPEHDRALTWMDLGAIGRNEVNETAARLAWLPPAGQSSLLGIYEERAHERQYFPKYRWAAIQGALMGGVGMATAGLVAGNVVSWLLMGCLLSPPASLALVAAGAAVTAIGTMIACHNYRKEREQYHALKVLELLERYHPKRALLDADERHAAQRRSQHGEPDAEAHHHPEADDRLPDARERVRVRAHLVQKLARSR